VRLGDDVEMAVGAVEAVGVVEGVEVVGAAGAAGAAIEGVALPVVSEQASSKQKLVSRFPVLGFLPWLPPAPFSSFQAR
jgi:hypothetical protein